jgi:hypothetical protein
MIYKDEYRLTVGQRLQGIRGARDQRTFADAVDSVQQTISKYERGEIPRSWLFLARLGAQEGVDLNELGRFFGWAREWTGKWREWSRRRGADRGDRGTLLSRDEPVERA